MLARAKSASGKAQPAQAEQSNSAVKKPSLKEQMQRNKSAREMYLSKYLAYFSSFKKVYQEWVFSILSISAMTAVDKVGILRFAFWRD